MRSLLATWFVLLNLAAAHADQPRQVVRIGDGKARAVAVAAAPDGSALIGIDLAASAMPERRENAGVDLKGGQSAAVVAAYTASGRLPWSNAVVADAGAPELRAIASAADGSSCAAGWYAGSASVPGSTLPAVHSAGAADAFVLGLAPDGAPRWLDGFGGAEADMATAAAAAPDGGCYVAGSFRGKADFGGRKLLSHGGQDAFVLRLDAAGKVVWALAFGGRGSDEAVALAPSSGGGVYALLRYTDTLHLDPDGTTAAHDLASAGSDDALVLHLDADGRVRAAQGIGSPQPDHFTALAADAAGVAVVGYFSTDEELKIGDRALALHNRGGAQALVLRLDSALKLERYTSTGGDDGMVLPLAAAYAPDGRLWVAGSLTGSVRIGKETLRADRTDGLLLGFDAQLRDPPRARLFGGERGQQLLAVAVSGDALHVAGVTSAVEKSEAERERDEAMEREQRKQASKESAGKNALDRARAEEEEREAGRSRSQAVLVRYRWR